MKSYSIKYLLGTFEQFSNNPTIARRPQLKRQQNQLVVKQRVFLTLNHNLISSCETLGHLHTTDFPIGGTPIFAADFHFLCHGLAPLNRENPCPGYSTQFPHRNWVSKERVTCFFIRCETSHCKHWEAYFTWNMM